MPKGVPNKKYTPEFKKLVVETMQEEHLGYCKTAERFGVRHKRVQAAAAARAMPVMAAGTLFAECIIHSSFQQTVIDLSRVVRG